MFFKNENSQIKLIYSLIILSIGVTSFSQKPLRVGYVNMDYILENFDDIKQANQEYSLKLNKWRREIEKTQKEIEKKYEELEIKRPLLTTPIYNELKEEINFEKSELEEYKQKRFGPEGDWIIQEKILIQPIQDEVLEAVQKIADKNKFDFIFDKSSAIIMLYSEKKYDISELVLKSILRQEKIENLQMNFDDEIKEKRRDSILKIKELKKISLQKKRDSIINVRKNKK